MDKRTQTLRRQGIGGSDIAAVMGINPYRSPHDVWMEKVGVTELSDEAPSEAAYWGQQVEDILCDEYARREQVCLHQLPPPGIILHPRDQWIMGSPDRFVGDAARIGMDAKMAGLRQSYRWGPEGTDIVPEEYLLQAQWYMLITEAERWDLAVLLGQQFRIYRVAPHTSLQQMLVTEAGRFWFDHVLPKVPPPVDHSAGAARMIRALYPSEQDAFRGATEEEIQLANLLRASQQALESVERSHEALRNQLCQKIGLSVGLMGPGFRLSWKRTKDIEKTDWKAVAEEMHAPESVIERHTERVNGVRRFRATYYDLEDEKSPDEM